MPLPIIAGVVAGGFLASLAKDLVADLVKDIIGNTQRGAIDYVKAEAFKEIFRQWSAEFFQSLLAKPHVASGIDPAGLLEMIIQSLLTVAKMSMIFSAEVTEELFMELLQEGFSNAVQFSVGGAFQNILSYWRGSYGVQTGQSFQVMNVIDYIDDHMLAWLLLSSGEHVITLMFEMLLGLSQKYDSDKEIQLSQIASVVDYINRVSFAYNETIRTEAERILARTVRLADEYYDRIVALADNLLERFISRVNEIDSEVQSHQILYQNGAISEDTFKAVLIEGNLLLDSTYNNYIYFIDQLQNEIANASMLPSLVEPPTFNNVMSRIALEYKKLIDAVSYTDYTQRIITAIDRINVVRTYDFPTGSTMLSPISLQPAAAPAPPGLSTTCIPDYTNTPVRC